MSRKSICPFCKRLGSTFPCECQRKPVSDKNSKAMSLGEANYNLVGLFEPAGAMIIPPIFGNEDDFYTLPSLRKKGL